MLVQEATGSAQPNARPPRRQLSVLRVLVAVAMVATAAYGISAAVRRVTHRTGALAPQWFAPYVDVTLTPSYPFENETAAPARQVVLGFVVASADGSCAPAWGAAYGLDEASTSLDLDRRLTRLRAHGADPIVSFGGAANTELASACADASSLQRAYGSVVERYQVPVIDLDLEGAGLSDTGALARRATAVAALQRDRKAAGHPLAVWLTLPVDANGLPPAAQAAVTAMLQKGVDLAGVNAMTMNFGDGGRLRSNIEHALLGVVGQLDTVYRTVGLKLDRAELWRRVGATPMIGLNDVVSEKLDLATATWLVDFARQHGVGRLSMWSLNRDTVCGANVDATKPSPHCSGIDQRPGAFAELFGAIGRSNSAVAAAGTSAVTTTVAQAGARTAPPDDPTKSPYPVWNPNRSYQQGRKVVWHGNVYAALWFTNGQVPDGASPTDGPVPWRLVGPVLPGEHPPVTTTIASGTYVAWDPGTAFTKGQRVQVGGTGYEAKWWTKGDAPDVEVANDWETPWQPLGVDPGDGAALVGAPEAPAPASTTTAAPAVATATTNATTTATTTASTTGTATTAAPVPSTSTAAAAGQATTAASGSSAAEPAAQCVATTVDPVRFTDGSWELLPAARTTLDALAQTARTSNLARITLVGRSDARPGLSVTNDQLSHLRADAVASYLRAKGVATPIAVDGRGDQDPVGAGSVATDRSVEITVACGPG